MQEQMKEQIEDFPKKVRILTLPCRGQKVEHLKERQKVIGQFKTLNFAIQPMGYYLFIASQMDTED